MVKKIKGVPMGATKSVATLGCPSGLKPDELTSCRYNYFNALNILNLSILHDL